MTGKSEIPPKKLKRTNRSQNQHIERAITDHVRREKRFIEIVQEGQNAKEFAEHAEVDNWLASWGTGEDSLKIYNFLYLLRFFEKLKITVLHQMFRRRF